MRRTSPATTPRTPRSIRSRCSSPSCNASFRGRATPDEVAAVLERLWGGPETLVVVSTDLSHYLPYAEGRAIDEHTASKIISLDADISGDEACGFVGLRGLLVVARRKGLSCKKLDLRSSGDTAGRGRDEVVGYGAFALHSS